MNNAPNHLQARWILRVQPRKWQVLAFNRWIEASKHGVVSVVTGGGKTVFAQMCMMAFENKHPDACFNIVVPTNALLDQWYVSLVEELNVLESEIGCYSGQEKSSKPRKINIFVINTAREIAPEVAKSSENSLLIVDECHRAGSPMNSLALRGTYKAALGLSATPEREYDDGFRNLIEPILGGVIYEYGYKEAAKDKVITDFTLVNVETQFLGLEEAEYSKLSKRAAMVYRRIATDPEAEFQLRTILRRRAAVSASAKMRVPLAAKLVLENRGQRVMVFHERVRSAEELVEILRKKKVSVTIYHSKIAPAVRRDNLRLFRRGEFDVLVSCRALDEGINVPEASVLIIASSTASIRQRIQRLGRVLRPSPGKSEATIYTIFVTAQEKAALGKGSRRLRWSCVDQMDGGKNIKRCLEF